jgi:hypothetical protein
MKRKIFFGLLCIFTCTSLVKAEENSFVKNGVFKVNAALPTSQADLDKVNSRIVYQYAKYLQDDEDGINKEIRLTDCSDDYTSCELVSHGCEVNGGCGESSTTVKVEWNSDSVENYSEAFKKIAPNGVITMNAITPTNDTELDAYGSYFGETNFYYLNNCNDDYSKCDLEYSEDTKGTKEGFSETHAVKVIWKETDANVKKDVDNHLSEIKKQLKSTSDGYCTYSFDDLSAINYYSHLKSNDEDFNPNVGLNYVEDLKKILEKETYELNLDVRLGDWSGISDIGGGYLTISYNNTIYGLLDKTFMVGINNVLYIPDDTANTKEAYMAAAKKRIDEYLGNTSTNIKVAGTIEDLLAKYSEEFDFAALGDTSKMGDYYYNITIGNVTRTFVILRDSSKIKSVDLTTTDSETNITISLENTSLPLDTKIQVKEIKENSKEFKNIKEVLNIKNIKDVQIYDFKLFSELTNQFISKLTNGEFKVSVPIKDSLKNKNLVAYYIKDNNEIEEHPVTVKDGIATFTTTHFSIYTIAEKIDYTKEEVPQTFDGIMLYTVVGIFGMIGCMISLYLKRKNEI